MLSQLISVWHISDGEKLTVTSTYLHFFKKIWANPGPFFVYFRPFHITNQLQIEKGSMECLGFEPGAAVW